MEEIEEIEEMEEMEVRGVGALYMLGQEILSFLLPISHSFTSSILFSFFSSLLFVIRLGWRNMS